MVLDGRDGPTKINIAVERFKVTKHDNLDKTLLTEDYGVSTVTPMVFIRNSLYTASTIRTYNYY